MHVLGVKINDLTKQTVLEKVKEFLNGNRGETIFTPNPEMLVEAHRNSSFKNILNSSSLNICDGRGLQIFSKVKERIPGVDLMVDICAVAEEHDKSVYLLGTRNLNTLEQTVEALNNKFPKLRIIGYATDKVTGEPDILFVAFGHKKQETWIHENLNNFPSIKLAMGVGGAFDMISGKKRRAPKLMRSVGLEWLWRLILEPKRVKRIFNAVIVFPYLCLTHQSEKR